MKNKNRKVKSRHVVDYRDGIPAAADSREAPVKENPWGIIPDFELPTYYVRRMEKFIEGRPINHREVGIDFHASRTTEWRRVSVYIRHENHLRGEQYVTRARKNLVPYSENVSMANEMRGSYKGENSSEIDDVFLFAAEWLVKFQIPDARCAVKQPSCILIPAYLNPMRNNNEVETIPGVRSVS